MGVVGRAEDLTLGRQVALNFFPTSMFGWAPDGSLLLTREVGTQETYALELEEPL